MVQLKKKFDPRQPPMVAMQCALQRGNKKTYLLPPLKVQFVRLAFSFEGVKGVRDELQATA